jgi:outer membrane lipoprotein-sorting protein
MNTFSRQYQSWFLLSVCVLLITTLHQSYAQTADELFAAVQKKYTDGASLRVKFQLEQENIRGSLALKRGNKYILDIGGGRTIICNGKTVWNYDAPQRKVVISDFRENPDNISPERIFLNFPRTYRPVLTTDQASGDAILTLTPAKARDQVSDMQRVVLRLAPQALKTPQSLKLKAIGIFDGTVQHDWTILDMKPDAGLTDAAFEWKPPQGAQVIDLRE